MKRYNRARAAQNEAHTHDARASEHSGFLRFSFLVERVCILVRRFIPPRAECRGQFSARARAPLFRDSAHRSARSSFSFLRARNCCLSRAVRLAEKFFGFLDSSLELGTPVCSTCAGTGNVVRGNQVNIDRSNKVE